MHTSGSQRSGSSEDGNIVVHAPASYSHPSDESEAERAASGGGGGGGGGGGCVGGAECVMAWILAVDACRKVGAPLACSVTLLIEGAWRV